MKILVLNCGSSSIKYQVFDMTNENVIAKGVVEKIGLKDARLKHKSEGKDEVVITDSISSHKTGISLILETLVDGTYGCMGNLNELKAVGHRIVHGGEHFNKSVLLNDKIIDIIISCNHLAPLHNPHNLTGISVITEVLGDIPQVGVFDTAFHQTMPDFAYLYGVSYDMYKKYAIRRYGFHGTSHQYVSKLGAEMVGIDINDSKIITCHLGNGSSITAIVNGYSVDTSMGLTPLEGVIMGTRCGNLDIGAAINIAQLKGLNLDGLYKYVNKECGLKGVSGVSSDMRDIQKAFEEDENERAGIALQMLSYSVRKYIGSYVAAMNGIDLIVFTGGIGENHVLTRAAILNNLNYLGVEFDADKNVNGKGSFIVTTKDSKIPVAVVETNEELVIARDTYQLVKNK